MKKKPKAKITITALTDQGNAGIKQHYQETSKVSLKNRLIFKTAGYKQELLSKDPYTLHLQVSNRHSKNPIFMDLLSGEIKKTMKANGCGVEDYSLEVVYDG